jgi:uncharacterized protein (TIGR03435 family)
MTTLSRAGVLAVLACAGIANAQNAQPKLEFEVASIKPSPVDPNGMIRVGCTGGPGASDPGMIRCTNQDFMNMLLKAYHLQHFQLVGTELWGPPRFEIAAKVPEGTTKEQLDEMWQNLLLDRFKLAIHHETREMVRYELVVGKGGPKFHESPETPPPAADAPKPSAALPGIPRNPEGYPSFTGSRQGMAITNGKAGLHYSKWTMTQLASQLSGQLSKPVTDLTGLTGKYDIALYWMESSPRVGASPSVSSAPEADLDSGPPLEKAIQDQLGLRLEARKGPVDFLVVDHIEKSPTGN